MTDTSYLAGRSAIVTGGSQGIGLATAIAIRTAGAGVMICGRSAGALEAAALRIETATASALDDVPGVGPKKKRALLQRFGTVAVIRAASAADIASVDGFSKASAAKLIETLGGGA